MIALKRYALWALLLSVAPPLGARAAQTAEPESRRRISKRVEPGYPDLAYQLRLSGKVKLALEITPEGVVKEVRTLGGHPVLAAAAEDVAKKWRYEPAAKASTEHVVLEFRRKPER